MQKMKNMNEVSAKILKISKSKTRKTNESDKILEQLKSQKFDTVDIQKEIGVIESLKSSLHVKITHRNQTPKLNKSSSHKKKKSESVIIKENLRASSTTKTRPSSMSIRKKPKSHQISFFKEPTT